MSPQQDEPDPGALEPRHRRQRRWSRKRMTIGACVVAAAMSVAAVAVILWTRDGETTTRAGDDRVGLVGLAPEGAKPSSPTGGELVLDFAFGHTMGDHGRFRVLVYADGRLIWQRFGDSTDADAYSKEYSTGLLEQRLTPEGVELVRTEVISTGLFDHDLRLASGEGLNYGGIDFRNGDRLVRVTWGNDADADPDAHVATPEQASALIRLDARLAAPASWLPASAWDDQEITAYVPSGYSVVYQGEQPGVGLSRVLALLPPRARDLLRAQDRTEEKYTNPTGSFVYWRSDLTNEEARALARILDDAGLSGTRDEFGLRYGGPGTEVSLGFDPLLPHET